MDYWNTKFEPIIVDLLKKKVIQKESSIPHALNYYMSRLNLEDHKTVVVDILTELHYCHCCNKHQLNKPYLPKKWVTKQVPVGQILECVCDCRHMARMICRMCE